MDISELTREELIALKKKIDTRLSMKRMLKSEILNDTDYPAKLRNALCPLLESRGVTDPHAAVLDLYKPIFKIVDLARGNYRVGITRAHSYDKVPTTPGGYLYVDDWETYRNMVCEIIDIVDKYAVKEDNHGQSNS